MKKRILVAFSLFCLVFALPVQAQSTRTTIERVVSSEEYVPIKSDPYEPYYLEPEPPINQEATLMVSNYVSAYGATGTVRIEPPGIDCTFPNLCQNTYTLGEVVTLTAIPDTGCVFTGWSVRRSDGSINRGLPLTLCLGTNNICEITLNDNMVVVPGFSPIVNSDLAVSLDITPQEPKISEPVTLNAKIRNIGIEKSLPTFATVSIYNIKQEDNITHYWSTEYYSSVPAIDPGAEHQPPSAADLVLPKEGKYIAKIMVHTPIEENMENNNLKQAIYVTDQATAVVQGSILQLDNPRSKKTKEKKIKSSLLILTGPENRRYILPANAKEYSFSNLKLGKYTLTLKSHYYQPIEHSFEILSGGQVKEIPIGLKKRTDPANKPPKAMASIDPAEGEIQEMFTLSGSGSKDPDRDPLRYEWDFNDDFTYKTGQTIEHRFSKSGLQTVTLTVIDPLGASASADVSAEVTVPPRTEFPTIIELPRNVR